MRPIDNVTFLRNYPLGEMIIASRPSPRTRKESTRECSSAEDNLVSRIALGDIEAASELKARYLGRLVAIAIAITGDAIEAEGVVDAMLEEACNEWPPERGQVERWLTRLVRRHARRRVCLGFASQSLSQPSTSTNHESKRLIMGTKKNNATVVNINSQRIGALETYVTNGKTEIPIAGAKMKVSEVVALFKQALEARKLVVGKRAEYKAALAARSEVDTKIEVTDEALKYWVWGQFGADSSIAEEFGYAPRKLGQKTAQAKWQAVERLRATRKARGTMGKKQRAKVKGAIGVDVAPRPAPVAPSQPTPAPSSGAPPASPVVTSRVTNGALPN